jgi:ATP-dependent Clp endopeptidase proteolytic subunit ClpP
MKTWFKFQAKADKPEAVEVSIYDDIGAYGVTAKAFVDELNQHKGKDVQVNINTPGGDMFAGLVMYNALRAHGSKITTKSMGVAASAGSIVFMAGDVRVMPENTFLMVHKPWTFTAGNDDELREMADTLGYLGESLVKTYVARTGIAEAEIREMLAADTYLSAEDAVAKGFADQIEPALKIAASFDLDRLPENVRAAFNAAQPDDPPADDPPADDPPADDPPAAFADAVAALAAKAGLSEYSAPIALRAASLDDAKAQISAAREIVALCKLSGKEAKAADFIRTAATIADVKAALLAEAAAEDETRRTSNVRAGGHEAPTGAAVWAKIFPNRQTKE